MKQVVRKSIKEKHNIEDIKPIYTLLIDGNSVMKMSMVDKRKSGDGLEYGMIYQTLLQIKIQLQKKDFNHVYFMLDGNNSGVLRYNLYKEYKANRDKNYESSEGKSEYQKEFDKRLKSMTTYFAKKDSEKRIGTLDETEEDSFDRQREIIYNILEELFCRCCMYDDVEGDDLIAYYVNNKLPNEKIVIVSGDRDLVQLISDDVCLYVTQLKKYVTPKNCVEVLGYTHENVLLKKILCGDVSDNIKGIKGMADKTFFKLFPDAVTKKYSLDEVLVQTEKLIEERAKNKKKPLVVMENILNRVTLGSQGKDIFEINDKIINLSNPLLTKEAKEDMDDLMHVPLDPSDRDFKNVYNIIIENKFNEFFNENIFSTFFSTFNGLIENEKKFFKKN